MPGVVYSPCLATHQASSSAQVRATQHTDKTAVTTNRSSLCQRLGFFVVDGCRRWYTTQRCRATHPSPGLIVGAYLLNYSHLRANMSYMYLFNSNNGAKYSTQRAFLNKIVTRISKTEEFSFVSLLLLSKLSVLGIR